MDLMSAILDCAALRSPVSGFMYAPVIVVCILSKCALSTLFVMESRHAVKLLFQRYLGSSPCTMQTLRLQPRPTTICADLLT